MMVSADAFLFVILPLMTLLGTLGIGWLSARFIRKDSKLRRRIKRYQR